MIYPEERETEQELEVEGDSGSVSPTPLYTGIRDLPQAIKYKITKFYREKK